MVGEDASNPREADMKTSNGPAVLFGRSTSDETSIDRASASAETVEATKSAEVVEIEVLGVGGTLPPLSGGTTFGTEFASAPRMRWKSRSQFVLVLMGYCIGIGNLWRFPYLCGKYGGGAFLFAYLVMLFAAAGPLFFYETVLGQKYQFGPAETFRKMAPSWVGLAYVPVAMVIFYLPYYQTIVAYALHYFLAAFQYPLPWVDNTNPADYLDDVVLHRVDKLGDPGSGDVNGRLLMELVTVWLITVLCLVKGIHSAGKAAYVTVILPVVLLICLLVVCVRLEGASEGLKYYLIPRWESLFSAEVWALAAGQIIFSLSPGTGTCIALASYHEKNYKWLLQDCALIAFCNSVFSILGGFVVFSVVGNLAHVLNKPVEEIAAGGEGLAFIVFAQGLAQLGGRSSQILAIMFFLTLLLLGLDSTFAIVETLQTYMNDWIISRNPAARITTKGSAIRLLAISGFLLFAGFPYVTRGGYHLLEISDHFVVTYCLTIGVFFEYIMIGHVYGAEKMLQDVKDSTGVELPKWCVTHLQWVAPAAVGLAVVMLVYSEVMGTSMSKFPALAVWVFGVIPVIVCLSFIGGPQAKFRFRRLFWGGAYPRLTHWTPDGLQAARERATKGGFKGFQDCADEHSSRKYADEEHQAAHDLAHDQPSSLQQRTYSEHRMERDFPSAEKP